MASDNCRSLPLEFPPCLRTSTGVFLINCVYTKEFGMYFSNYTTPTCFRFSRQGDRSLASWLQALNPYIAEWANATANVWPADEPFLLHDFNLYLRTYRQSTRLRLVPTSQPDQLPPPSLTDMYPLEAIAGSRYYAVCTSLILVNSCLNNRP